MKHKGVYSLLLILFLSALGLLAGCGKSEEQPEHLALIFGQTANTVRPSELHLQEPLLRACRTYGSVSILIPDGKPYVLEERPIQKPKKNVSNRRREALAQAEYQELWERMKGEIPQNKEVDLLQAIHEGARYLASKSGEAKQLLIFHSGLSTSGILDFTKGYLETMEPQDLVRQLKKESELPSLRGVSVTWYYCGDTVEPQQRLSNANRERLKNIWYAILKEAGAESILFKLDHSSSTEVRRDLPHVTPVEVLTTVKELEQGVRYYKDTTLSLDEDILLFEPGKAVLKTDPKQVLKKVKSLTDYLKEHPSYRVLLCGTTAHWGGRSYCENLSKERADVVKKLLQSAGVSPEQLITVGLGFDHIFHQEDLDEKGDLIESIAKKNRAVIILNYDSPRAKQCYNKD